MTFQEVRRHLGVEHSGNGRSSDDPADDALALGSVLASDTACIQRSGPTVCAVRQASWCHKSHSIFSDALALVRKEMLVQATFYRSVSGHGKISAGVGAMLNTLRGSGMDAKDSKTGSG